MRVTPRGGRDAVDGWTAGADGGALLKVRVAAAPADGQANAAVIALIAKTLRIPKRAVRIAAGETARIKRLEIEGLDAEGLAAVFGRPAP